MTLQWDPDPIAFFLPFIHHPIAWYGILFAAAFLAGSLLFRRRLAVQVKVDRLDIDVKPFCERLTFVVVIATIVGARLAHILFYEPLQPYLMAPWRIVMTWEGGRARHGRVAATSAAVWRFSRCERLSLLFLLDLMVPSAALIASVIRVGNFINQELVGKVASVPWAVVFGHPANGAAALPRHPAQLYEAFWYMVLFALSLKTWRFKRGQLVGLFIQAIFLFRFVVEFWKEPQSVYANGLLLNMGQLLSLPMLLFGAILFAWNMRKKAA